jgi:hypothetical protein
MHGGNSEYVSNTGKEALFLITPSKVVGVVKTGTTVTSLYLIPYADTHILRSF